MPDGNTVYLGGNFTYIGPNTGNGASLDIVTGSPLGSSLPRIDGEVRTVVSDGAGGWYIGGRMTAVNGVPRSHLAHITPDNTLDLSWNPVTDGVVRALALSGNRVYVGGDFSTVGGQGRGCIAALDAVTGAVTPWSPNANFGVYSLAVSGNILYVGGFFSTIGGQSRSRLAAFDEATGLVTDWNPSVDNYVNALAVSGNTVYAGGFIDAVGGQARRNVAAIDAATGVPTAWNPTANSTVVVLAVNGSVVYAGGYFTTIGGQTRPYFAALSESLPVPVELSSFDAQPSGNTVSLRWTTASEKNNAGFEVERVKDELENTLWEKIGFVKGAGTTTAQQGYTFTDTAPPSAALRYRLKQQDFDGTFAYSPEATVTFNSPQRFSLSQNYPNPFNPETVIGYELPTAAQVSLKIFDVLGREVATLVSLRQPAGRYAARVSADRYRLSGGVYFYRLQTGNFSATKKMLFIK